MCNVFNTGKCFLQTLIMGNRDVIDQMSSTNAAVLTSVLKLIDKYDLYGQVAYPKHHKQSEVPDIYRLAARTKVIKSSVDALEFFNMISAIRLLVDYLMYI